MIFKELSKMDLCRAAPHLMRVGFSYKKEEMCFNQLYIILYEGREKEMKGEMGGAKEKTLKIL